MHFGHRKPRTLTHFELSDMMREAPVYTFNDPSHSTLFLVQPHIKTSSTHTSSHTKKSFHSVWRKISRESTTYIIYIPLELLAQLFAEPCVLQARFALLQQVLADTGETVGAKAIRPVLAAHRLAALHRAAERKVFLIVVLIVIFVSRNGVSDIGRQYKGVTWSLHICVFLCIQKVLVSIPLLCRRTECNRIAVSKIYVHHSEK